MALHILPWAAAAFIGASTALAGPATAVPVLHTACGASEYENVDGNCVPRPEQSPVAPDGATAHCKDGTWSFSQHRRGTCSGHGGVAEWL
ncbi:DUF3761 domain-containing protein [Nocardia sp. CDC153]|uniref:DUF3761 domain-containing protein n=1 Tax=Nocardia sp. CDC153 TaxID=3112167 RepID=UPI002DBA11A0|nr:DUF3761 domain-containing protein [Nocardia sp. CDC153]MEC3958859.1 DUF3761 domain-containing protein [Nocardia sp. CDC153]